VRLLLLTSSMPNQIALINKIFEIKKDFSLIVERKYDNYQKTLYEKFCLVILSLLSIFIFKKTWNKVQKQYKDKYPCPPIEPKLDIFDINSQVVVDEINKLKPELVVVSGTSLLHINIIKEIQKYGKILNLHTGISPYVKGGPNCTNWCLYNREFAYIGNTILWLDAGIDSGNIALSEQVVLNGSESFFELHLKVIEHGHNLYLRAIKAFLNDNILPSISQNSINNGRLYLTKEWTPYKILIAYINFLLFYKKDLSNQKKFSKPSLVKLSK